MSRTKKNGPTIGDVAALAQASRASVSRVLNGTTVVDPQIAERVRAAAAELGYRPSTLARSLSLGRTGTVAVSVPDLRNPMLHTVIEGIAAAAADEDYHVLVSVIGEDISAEESHILDARQRCDGLILVNPRISAEQLRGVLAQTAPSVVINRDSDHLPAPNLSVDHFAGISILIEHLRELGHRNLAYVSGPPGAISETPRQLALEEACRHYPDLHIVQVTGGRSVEDGREAAQTLLSSGATAALVFNDLVAVGLLSRLHELGVDVPGELSVTGFDDIDIARCSSPPLTTVGAPHGDIGRKAWQEMSRMLSGAGSRSEAPYMFRPTLIPRASTAPVQP